MKGIGDKPIDVAVVECADALLRKAEGKEIYGFILIAPDEKEKLEEQGKVVVPQVVKNFFLEHGEDIQLEPAQKTSNTTQWGRCPKCQSPAYFRITELNWRCIKGHITSRRDMPGDTDYVKYNPPRLVKKGGPVDVDKRLGKKGGPFLSPEYKRLTR
jgi:hypothetical protein